MKNDRIRVGLIGANPDRGWAMGVHIPALQALPHFEMTAVGTTRQETAEAAANKWGVRGAYTDPRQLAVRRSFARGAVHLHGAPERKHPLFHTEQAERGGLADRRFRNPATVVADLQT